MSGMKKHLISLTPPCAEVRWSSDSKKRKTRTFYQVFSILDEAEQTDKCPNDKNLGTPKDLGPCSDLKKGKIWKPALVFDQILLKPYSKFCWMP